MVKKVCTSPTDDDDFDNSPLVQSSERSSLDRNEGKKNVGKKPSVEQHFEPLIKAMETSRPMSVGVFESLFKPIQAFLLGLALGIFHSRGDRNASLHANEAVQRWHLKMITGGYASYRRYAVGRPFVPFAITALRNICIDIARERKSLQLGELEGVDSRLNPVKSAIQSELSADLKATLETLRPEEVEIIWLYFWDQMRVRDIASYLGLNPRTVSTRMYRALFHLYDKLEKRKGDFWPCERP